jgi:hypothetical protein
MDPKEREMIEKKVSTNKIGRLIKRSFYDSGLKKLFYKKFF